MGHCFFSSANKVSTRPLCIPNLPREYFELAFPPGDLACFRWRPLCVSLYSPASPAPPSEVFPLYGFLAYERIRPLPHFGGSLLFYTSFPLFLYRSFPRFGMIGSSPDFCRLRLPSSLPPLVGPLSLWLTTFSFTLCVVLLLGLILAFFLTYSGVLIFRKKRSSSLSISLYVRSLAFSFLAVTFFPQIFDSLALSLVDLPCFLPASRGIRCAQTKAFFHVLEMGFFFCSFFLDLCFRFFFLHCKKRTLQIVPFVFLRRSRRVFISRCVRRLSCVVLSLTHRGPLLCEKAPFDFLIAISTTRPSLSFF